MRVSRTFGATLSGWMVISQPMIRSAGMQTISRCFWSAATVVTMTTVGSKVGCATSLRCCTLKSIPSASQMGRIGTSGRRTSSATNRVCRCTGTSIREVGSPIGRFSYVWGTEVSRVLESCRRNSRARLWAGLAPYLRTFTCATRKCVGTPITRGGAYDQLP